MNLEELQTARDRERQTDKLQQLRESFYSEAGEFIQQLRAERERAAERADDPFDAPEVNRLTDEINTAEQTVEAIYEKRVGKIVKAASFAAADLPAEAEGMTVEEQDLFETLVGDIKQNRQHVLSVLAGEDDESDDAGNEQESGPAPDSAAESATEGVSAADLMGSGSEAEPPQPPEEPPVPGHESPEPDHEPPAPPESPPEPTADAPEPPTDTPTSVTDEGNSPAVKESTGGPETSNQPREPKADTTGDQSGTDDEQARAVRNDGGQPSRTDSAAAAGDQATKQGHADVERRTVRVTDDIDTFIGSDERDYDLEKDDVVTLPEANASLLIERDAAEQL